MAERAKANRAGVAERVRLANEGREPERLALKYSKMSSSPFVFLRGSCNLFWEDWPRDGTLSTAPDAWICGDLHFENFGAYKGNNRLEYWDINDFDEAVLAPCTLDIARFLVSMLLGAKSLLPTKKQAEMLCRYFLNSYADALADGKARWIERETAKGMVKDLLKALARRKRKELLGWRTTLEGQRRKITIDGAHALKISPADRNKVREFMQRFSARQKDPKFYAVRDVARRIAGTGSLGVERYVVLIEGRGSPNKNYLLDLKQAAPPSAGGHLDARQPQWANEAERVVTIQKRLQAASPASLQAVEMVDRSYILRELQPVEDRLSLGHWNGKIGRLETAMNTFGEVVAWAHLRGSGRHGASSADLLIEFGKSRAWIPQVFDYAQTYARQVERDWEEFKAAMDANFFAAQTSTSAN
jgi:uncharacterized protein (DUF2252 family)